MTRNLPQNHLHLATARICWVAIPLLAAACTGCGGSSGESKMTSYTASESKADSAHTFQITQDQLAHIQVAPVLKGNLPRTLRLTGAVAYNAFETAPVFSPIGGPVQQIFSLTAPSPKPISSRLH